MEGPSLYLAAEQLAAFNGKNLIGVSGNTKIGKERLEHKKVLDIFSWGKHLVFQFDRFALRVHFMLFGSFEATVANKQVTGDYKKKNRDPRLALTFRNGHIEMYSCSLKFLESSNAKNDYDFSTDIMSERWDEKMAIRKIAEQPNSQIADILLDQTIFSGVGNIIKNEVLFLAKTNPEKKTGQLKTNTIKEIVRLARIFSRQFYEWRKDFQLRKHLQIYRKNTCPKCSGKVIRQKTGLSQRWSFYCPHCQKLKPNNPSQKHY